MIFLANLLASVMLKNNSVSWLWLYANSLLDRGWYNKAAKIVFTRFIKHKVADTFVSQPRITVSQSSVRFTYINFPPWAVEIVKFFLLEHK